MAGALFGLFCNISIPTPTENHLKIKKSKKNLHFAKIFCYNC